MQDTRRGFVVTTFETADGRTFTRSKLGYAPDRVTAVRAIEEHAATVKRAGGNPRLDIARHPIRAFLEGTTDFFIVPSGPGPSGSGLCAYVDPCEVLK